ncbi:hypothetical protein [Solemya velesiana gill symbiont]|uniref:PilZ domain-containing protein n=1 Tax=Solemya velesiana gill symbiont TaxID=1918948 RepID=A0A1T2KYT7_9GAMM|nr:hypothetical protein [Solemya velesiana gill symbiont]OOZ37886.1 hypothetical protein BOW51_00315 [Solemya velesiana gill symbiont]
MTIPSDINIRTRKRIRVACSLDLISGLSLQGYTKEISLDGVFMESQGFSLMGRRPPQQGDSGAFTLYFKKRGQLCHIKMHCTLTNVVSNGLGLSINYSGLTRQDHELLMDILRRESDRLD